MLPKEDREIISKIGRYHYRRMKELNLSYEEYLQYQKQREEDKKIKEKIGYKEYNKMKGLGFNYQEYKQYQKEQKLKKYEKKREKDKIRFRTIRYIERYCNLEMKCQICKSEENIEIHHPNYKDYLKVNLLCKQHHTQLHNFELVPPEIISLEEIAIKKPLQKARSQKIMSQIEDIKTDILSQNFTYQDLYKKYGYTSETLKRRLCKQENWARLKEALRENAKRKVIIKSNSNKENFLTRYKEKFNLTTSEVSKITGIPRPTLAKIESGQTDLSKVKPKTKQKLNLIISNL